MVASGAARAPSSPGDEALPRENTTHDITDVQALARSPLLSGLPVEELGVVLQHLERLGLPAGTKLAHEGERDDALGIVLEGAVRAERRGTSVLLGPGDLWGELVLAGTAVHASTVTALGDVRVALLHRAKLGELTRSAPRIALHLTQALLSRLAAAAAAANAAPSSLVARDPGRRTAADVVPRQVGSALVVGASLDHRPASLASPVPDGCEVSPITTATWVGREIFRQSAGLLLLEAAHMLGMPDVRLGPSITTGRPIQLARPDPASFASMLHGAAMLLVERDAPFVEEVWDVDAAIAHFEKSGWSDAATLLIAWRGPTVTLVRCGSVLAISQGPMLPSTGLLGGISVVPYPGGLLLDFGEAIRRALPSRPVATLVLERAAPRYGAKMTLAEKRWLELFGLTSVGSFNVACMSGRVREIVHLSEGFHEKHIAETADDIAARRGARVVAVAGPSSSGKTTFIKRLKVQLEVVGIHPVELSLDDYYKDRGAAPRDADGQPDFEALEALDLELLEDHVRRLLAGERVRTARFDFLSGRSDPQGGPELSIHERELLLVEGIHGLNPRLFGDAEHQPFRVFVHVATSLPFDRLSWLEPADVRLLRRIVRDRHQRGSTAADSLSRWPSVRRGERLHIHPYQGHADRVFDSSLIYEASVLKVFAERYLLEVPRSHPEFGAAQRLRRLLDPIIPIEADHVPPTSILREFVGQSGFSY